MVDCHDRKVPGRKLMDVLNEQLGERWPKDHAIHSAIDHTVDLSQFIAASYPVIAPARRWAGMNAPQSDGNMVRRGKCVVDPRQHLRPEEVERWHHDADHSCFSRLNALDQQIRSILQSFSRLQHALAGLVGIPSPPG